MKRKYIFFSILFCLIVIGVISIFYIQYLNTQKLSKKQSTETNVFKDEKSLKNENIPMVEEYSVPILMYHYIRNAENEDQLGKNLSVSPENFDKHLNWLKENDYETIRLADLADPEKIAISRVIYEKKKPIVLTFDDGYLDAYTDVFPTLKKYQLIGTFFIIRNYIDKTNYMNQEQIDELINDGMEIGSHSLTHPNLTKINYNLATNQIFDSKENSNVFCYPAGKFNNTVVDLVEEAGYLAAVTTKFGVANQDSNLFELRRVRIENGSAETLKFKIEAAYDQTPK